MKGATVGRTLTGAWIETSEERRLLKELAVAPSRVRGLKREGASDLYALYASHPHGCVD